MGPAASAQSTRLPPSVPGEAQPPRDNRVEEHLRQKIQSKMTVSTLLAGFSFTALTMVLSLKDQDLPAMATQIVLQGGNLCMTVVHLAAFALLFSSAFFVASTLSYDKLMMPFQYYENANTETAKLRVVLCILARLCYPPLNGKDPVDRVFAYMLMAWAVFFMPGILFAGIGIVTLFYALTSPGAAWIIGGAIAMFVLYYVLMQPRVTMD